MENSADRMQEAMAFIDQVKTQNRYDVDMTLLFQTIYLCTGLFWKEYSDTYDYAAYMRYCEETQYFYEWYVSRKGYDSMLADEDGEQIELIISVACVYDVSCKYEECLDLMRQIAMCRKVANMEQKKYALEWMLRDSHGGVTIQDQERAHYEQIRKGLNL